MMRVDLVGWALLMIALALGYSVCIKASRAENKGLKMLGYVIAIIVLVVTLVLAISDLGTRLRMKRGVMAGPQRPAGMTTRPLTTPNVNIPAIPKAPKAPAAPNIPVPPAAPKVQ